LRARNLEDDIPEKRAPEVRLLPSKPGWVPKTYSEGPGDTRNHEF